MKVSAKNPLEFWGQALGDKSAEMNKRATDHHINQLLSFLLSSIIVLG